MTQELLVLTNYGPVKGRHRIGWEDVKYVSFQGIPYARPPVGDLRFKVNCFSFRIHLFFYHHSPFATNNLKNNAFDLFEYSENLYKNQNSIEILNWVKIIIIIYLFHIVVVNSAVLCSKMFFLILQFQTPLIINLSVLRLHKDLSHGPKFSMPPSKDRIVQISRRNSLILKSLSKLAKIVCV